MRRGHSRIHVVQAVGVLLENLLEGLLRLVTFRA